MGSTPSSGTNSNARSDLDTNFTALGDTVNATARLASAAASGEILISESALALADFDLDAAERRELQLRGREAPPQVRVATVETLKAAA